MSALGTASRLADKLVNGGSRVAARRIPFRPLRLNLAAPLVSFTFDDFPLSAAENAAPALEAAGMRGTFYYAGGLAGRLENGQEIAGREVATDLAARGHEIGAHTHAHLNVQKTPMAELMADVARNIAEVKGIAGAPVTSFAYPYGVLALRSKLALASRFAGLRGIQPGINAGRIDLAHLLAQELYDASSNIDDVSALLDEVERLRGWLIFYTHDVRDNPSSIGCSPGYFRAVVELVKARGIAVATVAQVLDRIGATGRQTRSA